MTAPLTRRILSATLFGFFILMALATSEAPKKALGENALALAVHDNKAFVLHHAVGPYQAKAPLKNRLQFSRITIDGERTTLHNVEIPPTKALLSVQAADMGGAVAFTLGRKESGGLFSLTFTEEKSAAEPLVQSESGIDEALVLHGLQAIRRDSKNWWVWVTSASGSTGKGFAPLWEITEGIARPIASSVLWADCKQEECRFIRYVAGTNQAWRLQLYSLAPRSVTPQLLDEAFVEAYTYATGQTNGSDVLIFGRDAFLLSPDTTKFKRSADSFQVENQPTQGHKSFRENFFDGSVISVNPRLEESPSDWFCDAACREEYEVWEVEVSIKKPGEEGLEFVLTDY